MKQNRIIYISLLILSLFFVFFYGGKIPYMFLYVLIILPLISLTYTIIVLVRFKYLQELDSKFVIKGDNVNLIFKINNEDFFLYPYMRINFYGEKTIFLDQFQVNNFSLLPHQNKSYKLKLECKYRGYYEIGINSVEVEDIFGLFKIKYDINEPHYITVYPGIIKLDRFSLKTDFLSESYTVLNTNSEDMSTIAGFRNYIPGDSLKRIHWKLTAKSQNMMVKKFQSTSETSAVMIVDLRAFNYSPEQNIILEDKVIETVVSVLHYCLYNWIPVNLIYYSKEMVNIYAKNHLMFNDIYETLAKIKFDEDIPVKDLLEVYVNDKPAKTNILVFTSTLDYDLYNQIYKTSLSGYDVSLIYTNAEVLTGIKDTDTENILEFLPEINVNTYNIGVFDNTKLLLER